MRRIGFYILCILLLSAGSSAETPQQKANRERITELRAQEEINQARILELGGSRVSSQAIRNLENDISMLEGKADRFEAVAKTFAKNTKELRELQQQVRDGEPFTLEDAAKMGGKMAAQAAVRGILEKLALEAASKATGVVGKVMGAAEFLAKKGIRNVDANKIRDMLRAEQASLHDVLQFVSAIREERNATAVKLNEVKRLRDEQRRLHEEIANLNQRATDDANLERTTDVEGDEALRKEEEAERLCKPNNRKKPGRVGAGNTLGLQMSSAEGAAEADDQNCRLIDGSWELAFQKSGLKHLYEITFTGPEEPGPGTPATFLLTPQRGWKVRCTAEDTKLVCETALPPPPTCPGVEWPEWQKRWEMDISAEGLTITGVWEPTLIVINPPGQGCRVEASPFKMEQAFTLTPVPQEDGAVSAK
jgi:hypothetical protein